MDRPAASEAGIERLRRQLGEIDHELLDLLNRRMDVAREIGEWKRRNALSIFDPIREEGVIAELLRRNAGSLSDRAIRAIFLEIFSSARAQQGILRIGCGGGAAGLLAAHGRFGASDRYRRVRSAADGIALLEANSIDILVLPKEGLLDLAPALRQKIGSQLGWSVCGEIAPLHASAHRRDARPGFYIVRLGAEPPGPPELPYAQRILFSVGGCSRESIDRWSNRHGDSWKLTGCAGGAEEGRRADSLVSLWEAFSPPPFEALQEICRELCGNSAWIVRLGAYPISSVARL